jgi:hypothetical protein
MFLVTYFPESSEIDFQVKYDSDQTFVFAAHRVIRSQMLSPRVFCRHKYTPFDVLFAHLPRSHHTSTVVHHSNSRLPIETESS